MQDNKINRFGTITMPAMQHPGFRSALAAQDGVHRNILFKTWGGLGDQICAEPTLRYAINKFRDCEIFLASEIPEIFQHLKFNRVFDLNQERPVYEKYLVFETITPPDESNLVWLFFSHMLTNCVDFPSLCSIRSQLPVADREVELWPAPPPKDFLAPKQVWIHAGRHWQSKTFPKDWWNAVVDRILDKGFIPVLIGADTDDNRGTVDVQATGCLDLRNKLSVNESIWHLQRCGVLLTNDSSPLHMAASKGAVQKEDATYIGYIATCKHPDYITHWRHGEWSYRMKNLGSGGMWDLVDHCPNKGQKVTVDEVSDEILRSWLPNPGEFADWGCDHATT